MSVETQQMMSSDPASLRKQREESIAERRRLLVAFVTLSSYELG
mgnify:FL=1